MLQSIVNYAIRLDMLGCSPCRGINLPKAAPVRRHVVDAAEPARLAKALGGVEGYAQVVTDQQQATADAAMAARFDPTPRDERGIEALDDDQADPSENDTEGL